MLSNKVIQDPRLSLAAKGLYAYIMALPDNWKLYRKTLHHTSKDGTKGMKNGYTSMNTAFMELVNCGYIEMEEKFNAKTNLREGYKYKINLIPPKDDGMVNEVFIDSPFFNA